MLFNSISFALFLPVVFILYWFATSKSLKAQNMLLLGASYFFYACWDYRFLFLLIFSTLLDYFTGLKIAAAPNKGNKRMWLWLSIGINLGFLAFFKYCNFFSASFSAAVAQLGFRVDPWTIKVILPVGISFYTFHGLSYVIDIYKDRIRPEKSFIDYSVFVSFFPLLVAGPIERATHLLPQIKKKRIFDYAKAIDGLRQILWGLFKKVVIADQCSHYVNMVFNNSAHFSGSEHVVGVVLFAFQIYCDFSGYSDIALGVARLFGIELLRNFAFPYFSRDIAEFWRRWHISLSSWFKDYLYIPLGGSKGGVWMKIRNTFIIFLVSGFWHGANWTFIIWGLLNAIYFLPLLILNKNRTHLEIAAKGRLLPSGREVISIVLTFSLTVFAWIFFRAASVGDAIRYITEIFSTSFFTRSGQLQLSIPFILIICFFLIIEWLGREHQYALELPEIGFPKFIKWSFYYALVFGIWYFAGSEQQFIYFQF
ncbi:MBOAT family O-acyltransferase [Mucilaginibacter sp. SP1R1]|uniref:MBOAT family O-acyltransferase n=1 Tax=Mucilaginibacter sp. SP1R1 TaxID=2723091 RepID=UPI001619F334|nr:MBOAT family protein [Mucilaginibacter sp. SP1R1]MBB6152587.1 D-alanyl-lipoteichoic acid acyltransferase DltB (MBOAT superfamily) [Mucilaginibacter sp. SP1R1]